MEILEPWDVIVVGGGPAGLSAALMLGRCRRRVLLFDDGRPRNAASLASHGFFTRDGVAPGELRGAGREQLGAYGVEIRDERVDDVWSVPGGFQVSAAGGAIHAARKLLLATGVEDRLPQVEGLPALFGRSVFHCPYCDGWEVRDTPLAAYGRGTDGADLALALLDWSEDVVFCTDGGRRLPPGQEDQLRRQGIRVRQERLRRLEGRDGVLERIVFEAGPPEPRRALFFHTGTDQRSELPRKLGCSFTRKGAVRTARGEGAGVPGLYVVGDASPDLQWIAVAAAEGAKAAFALNKALRREDLSRRAAGT